MAKTFFSTLLLIFISSRYFIHNARKDIESDIVIQMTLEHVLVQRFKRKEMDGKKIIIQALKCSPVESFGLTNDTL